MGEVRQSFDEARKAAKKAREQMLAGRTPAPDCHLDSAVMPTGKRVKMKVENGVLAWGCVTGESEYFDNNDGDYEAAPVGE